MELPKVLYYISDFERLCIGRIGTPSLHLGRYFIYEYIDCCSLLFVASENATCWVGLNFAIFLLCSSL